MQQVVLSEKEGLNFIKDQILLLKRDPMMVSDAKYHHSTKYENANLILQHGILSLKDSNEKGFISLSKKQLQCYSDVASHINGIDHVSLAVLGLDDLYADEIEFDPRDFSESLDFLVSNDINSNVRRSTEHYGNEYLHHGSIGVNNLMSVDIRLLKFIELVISNEFGKKSSMLHPYTTKDVIQKYHVLRGIALQLKQMESQILLREQSMEDDTLLDIEEASKLPQIVLK